MKFYLIIYLSFFIFFISCKKESAKITNQDNTQKVEQNEQNDKKFSSKVLKIGLSENAQKHIENWQEYQNVAEFILKFYKTTTKEALFNSQRLVELTQQLKDTIRVKKFDEPSFRIRLNVLHNEALRLADMDSIPSITNKEIILESNNIVNAFEAVKSKINTVINKQLLEKDLEEFDDLFNKKDSLELIDNSVINKMSERQNKKRNLRNKIKKKPKKFNKRIQPLTKLKVDESN